MAIKIYNGKMIQLRIWSMSLFKMIFIFLSLVKAKDSKVESVEMNSHRFRQAVFHREDFDTWVTLLSDPEYKGHDEAKNIFYEAYKIGKGFLKFAFLDTQKNPNVPKKLEIKKEPTFCIFYTSGRKCLRADISARELVNLASSFIPDFIQEANEQWMRNSLDIPGAILFTEKPTNPMLWAAISNVFHKYQVKIGVSRDKEFASKLGLQILPGIVLFNITNTIVYDGKIEFDALKTTIKKFMSKKLMKINPVQKIHPMSEYNKHCNKDTKICIFHVSPTISQEMEIARKRHTTTLLEFLYGIEHFPIPFAKPNKLYAIDNTKLEYYEIGSIDKLEEAIPLILDNKVEWNQIPQIEEPFDI